MVGRAVLDGATIADRRLVDQLFHSMDRLGATNWLGITMACLEPLQKFNGSRYAGHAKDEITRIRELACEELSEREFRQLEEFLDDGTEIDLEHLATDLEKPIAVVAMPFRDEQADSAYILNYRFFKADPRAWQAEAERLLNSKDTSLEIRKVIILHMAAIISFIQLCENRSCPFALVTDC